MSAMALPHSQKFIGAVEDEWQLYSDRSQDYTLGVPIGYGASSIVYAALYHPQPPSKPIPCALKVLDLDSLPPHALRLLQRETTLMSLSKHPNVLRVRGSWMDGHKLYIAMRLMNRGSAADVMRYGWPGGMEEEIVKCILKQALEGLNYLHINGFIHRDVKAANMLIDDDGTVLLGDLGVAANLADDNDHPHLTAKSFQASHTGAAAIHAAHIKNSGNELLPKRAAKLESAAGKSRPRMGKRKSFVGTPCWMAPELIQGHQYDASADIWSFGITALELTQGRPPRSRESSSRVLLRTVQDAPPTLEREGGTYKYSRAFKEVVESCLVKDPSQRPTAAALLQTAFFRSAKKKSYLVSTLLADLPPLAQRQERAPIRRNLTQTHRSVDSWDFNSVWSTRGASPTASVFKRVRAPGLQGEPGMVFEGGEEEEDAWEATRSSRRSGTGSGSGSGRHSKAVSWIDRQDSYGENTHERVSSEDGHHYQRGQDGQESRRGLGAPIAELHVEREIESSTESQTDSGADVDAERESTPGTSPTSIASVCVAMPAHESSDPTFQPASSAPGFPSPLKEAVSSLPASLPEPSTLSKLLPTNSRTASATSPAAPSPTSIGTTNSRLWRKLTRSNASSTVRSRASTAVGIDDAEEGQKLGNDGEGGEVQGEKEKRHKAGIGGLFTRKANTSGWDTLARMRSRNAPDIGMALGK